MFGTTQQSSTTPRKRIGSFNSVSSVDEEKELPTIRKLSEEKRSTTMTTTTNHVGKYRTVVQIGHMLDRCMPRWLWWIALIFFLLGSICIVFFGYIVLHIRIVQYNELMPKNLVRLNLKMNLLFDILFGWFGWGFLSASMVSIVWTGLALYGILHRHYIAYVCPLLDQLIDVSNEKWIVKMKWSGALLLWMTVFNWYFRAGFMPSMADMNLNAHGSMAMYSSSPPWFSTAMGSNSERLTSISDLDTFCPIKIRNDENENNDEEEEEETSCTMRIEKIIHQTYKTRDNLPEQWKDTPEKWQELHPDWTYMFWTDKSMREFIALEYPWFLETFDSYQYPIQRADAIRYFALYHYGGVYSDMDLQPKENIERMFSGVDVVNFETPNIGLTNMMLAAKRGSKLMACVIGQLGPRQFQMHHIALPARGWQILSSTGPTFWWAMNSMNMCNDGTEKIRTVSAEFMGRCSLCAGDVGECKKNGKFRHLSGSTWHKKDQGALNFLFCEPTAFWAAIFIPVRSLFMVARWKVDASKRQTGIQFPSIIWRLVSSNAQIIATEILFILCRRLLSTGQ